MPNRINAEWEALVRRLEHSLDTISRSFTSLGTSTAESILSDVEAGIRRGYCALHNRPVIVEILKKYGLVRKWDEIANYAMLATNPADEPQQIMNSTAAFSRQTAEFLIALRRAAIDTQPLGGSTSFLT